MDEKDYKPGQIVIYNEEQGKWIAEVVENSCSENEVSYALRIIKELSRPAAGFGRIKIGQTTRYQRPNDSVFVGNGFIESLV